jgi:hypothetical protein
LCSYDSDRLCVDHERSVHELRHFNVLRVPNSVPNSVSDNVSNNVSDNDILYCDHL